MKLREALMYVLSKHLGIGLIRCPLSSVTVGGSPLRPLTSLLLVLSLIMVPCIDFILRNLNPVRKFDYHHNAYATIVTLDISYQANRCSLV